MQLAEETLETARLCYDNEKYRDANNRSYYAVFYAVRAVLAMEKMDFRRHRDVLAYFNKTYIASGQFPREMGKKIGKIKIVREESDYNDLYVISKKETLEQINAAEYVYQLISEYLGK